MGSCDSDECMPAWFNLPHFRKLSLQPFAFVPIRFRLDDVGLQTPVLPRINVNERLHIN